MTRQRLMAQTVTAVALVAVVAVIASTPDERAAVVAVTREYRDAWLANDGERVMRTLAKDAVLFPSGMARVGGENAIRRFWFPKTGPKTTVTAMDLRVSDVQVSGTLAIVSGDGTLSFTIEDASGLKRVDGQRSWYVNVLERQPDGRWLITRRAWSDLRR